MKTENTTQKPAEPKPKREKTVKQITLYLEPADIDLIDAAASAARLTRTSFIRQATLAGCYTAAQAQGLTTLINRLGWNDVRALAVDDKEAAQMTEGIYLLRSRLNAVGLVDQVRPRSSDCNP